MLFAAGCARHPATPTSRTPSAFDADAIDVTVDWDGTPPPSEVAGRPAAIALTASDGSGLRLASIEARSVLYGPLAYTELHLAFENPEERLREGTFSIALPESAAVSRFAMRLAHGWQEGEIVEREKARDTYERYVHRRVDPALFEKDAGNVFRGRVYPIMPRQKKELVIAWSEELPDAAQPYRLALHGLPRVDTLDVALLVPARKKAFVLHRAGWTPDRDFVHRPPPGSADAVRAGDLVVSRSTTPATPMQGADAAIGSLAVALDSSASQAGAYAENVKRVERLVASLGAKSVQIACFDQEVVRMPSLAAAAARRPGGASDLRAALRWLKESGASRAVLVSDGLASTGPFETKDLATLAAGLRGSGVERLDAIATGGARNQEALVAITTAGLARAGVVVDTDRGPDEIARALRSAARPSAKLVYEKTSSLPAQADEAPSALLERAFAKAKIEELVRARNAIGATDADQTRLRKEIVDLSTRHRVLSPFTSMLVLETERDYERFSIDHRALRDILVVGPRGVELVPRGGGPVLLPRHADDEQVPPILDFRAREAKNESIDSDGDGIPDAQDKCPMEPETFNGFEDEDGCPDRPRIIIESGEIRILQAIHFTDGGAVILPESFPLMEALAQVMQQNPQIELVELQGHTDNRGSEEANQRLSLARARAVRDDLIKRGVEADRLTARGFGSTRPIVPNDNDLNRARNRRVEMRILVANGAPTGADPLPPGYKMKTLPGRPMSSVLLRGKGAPHGAPLDGTMKHVDELVAQGRAGAALDVARDWEGQKPNDLLAAAAEGRALEALGRFAEAARAYGSMLDLASKPEHRRAAAAFLESLGSRHSPAMEIALDAYRRVLGERPEQPSTHRLVAHALARAGRPVEALDTTLSAARLTFDPSRYPGAKEQLLVDAGLFAAAAARGRPTAERQAIEARLRSVGATIASSSATLLSLSWETDESDLDLRVIDDKGTVTLGTYDVRTGFGPEGLLLEGSGSPMRLEVHQVTRGPSGFALGKVAIVRHDGSGGLSYEDRPFVVMNDGAAVALGSIR